MQLRSSSNQPLDLSTLFICCKLEDDSWGVHTPDVGASAAVLGEGRAGVEAAAAASSGKKAATRSATTATVIRPRDDNLPTEVRHDTQINKQIDNPRICDFFPVALETLSPMSVSAREFLLQIGRRPTPEKPSSDFNACQLPSNDSMRPA